jgi:hypothetical protein
MAEPYTDGIARLPWPSLVEWTTIAVLAGADCVSITCWAAVGYFGNKCSSLGELLSRGGGRTGVHLVTGGLGVAPRQC